MACSTVFLDEKVLVFPAGREGEVVSTRNPQQGRAPLDHATVDLSAGNRPRTYLSPPRDEEGAKRKIWPAKRLVPDEEGTVHLGTVVFASWEILDQAGLACMALTEGIQKNPYITPERLRDAVGGNHLVGRLPSGTSWTDGHNVQIGLFLSEVYPPQIGDDLPLMTDPDRFEGPGPEDPHPTQISGIKLESRFLVAAASVVEGRPTTKLQLEDGRYTWEAGWITRGN